MAGYGNRTSSINPEDLSDQHDSTRLDLTHSHTPYSNAHPRYGSGATGGAGFGNKSDPSPTHTTNDEFRFDRHTDTAPYTGAAESRAGSGSTGGAGWGNKTGEFGKDSTVGKVMQKVGGMVHNEGLVEKGGRKREEAQMKAVRNEEGPWAN